MTSVYSTLERHSMPTLHDTQKHTQQRDGGGLQPTAVNPDYWDLVPHSDIHQQHGSRDGVCRIYAVTRIRTMRWPIDRSTAKESSFERALTGINPTFDLQRKNQTVRASIRVCA